MTPERPVREVLEGGEEAIGARCMTRAPMFVEIYGELGFDFAWMDVEHGGQSPWGATTFEGLVRAAAGADVDLLVRLPSGDLHLIRKVLDTGVRTFLIPRVETAAEVRRAVEASRFRYDGGAGERGAASGLASDWGSADGYVEREDATPLVGVMIESVREACLDAGVPVGRIANDVEEATEAIASGYRLLRVGSEVTSTRSVLGERLADIVDGA